ncbi:hypothetical protein QL285_015105 [Trifolium repens]|nr:hypothetical protein QL285_015105 [Trifolium repens]
MASSSNPSVDACMILPKESNPTVFAKDQRPYKYDDLNVAIENPVDLEGLRVNGFSEVVDLFKRQGMEYYFDVLNGPTYTKLVKEFWMKAFVITREKYNQKIEEMIEENPELKGKTPKEMGLRPFAGTEIESFVSGFRISIRVCHICEALKIDRGGLVIRNSDEVGSDVEDFIFKPKADPKDKLEWTNNCKVIYKILIDSILTKLGGTDQISNLQKLFTFHVGKGNFLDIDKLIFDHLAVSILSSKSIVRHSRLLSHMFAQCGLLDTITPFLPGYGTFLLSSKIVNSTTLRYLKLVKNNQIVHSTRPLLIKDSEDNIAECRLVHVSDSEAKRVIEAHADYLKKLGAEVGTGEPTGLTIRQSRILEQPTRIYPAKRKAVKSPAGKKVAKTQKTTAPKSSKKPKARKIVMEDLTEEEKENAVLQAALEKVNEFNKKQEALNDGYDCGIDLEVFKDMYSKLPPRSSDDVLAQQTMCGMADGKFSNFIGGSSAFRDYFRRLQYPSEIKVKHVFDKIFKGVNSKKDLTLSKNQPSSEQFNPIQTNPSESQANNICNDAAQASTSTAPVIHSFDEDSERIPSPPPQKSPTHHDIQILEPTPNSENVQPETTLEKPPTPHTENEPQPQTPPPEHTHSEHENQKSPEPTVAEVVDEPNSKVHADEQSPHHVAMDNSCSLPTPLKKHFQQIDESLNMEVIQKTPPHQTNHLKNLMQDLSLECIYVPPHLPSRIVNEPLEQTQDDISSLLQAVDKSIRKMSSVIPNRSIETAHINKECDIMEENLVLMIRSIKQAYTKDLDFRIELARKEEEERLLRERLEAEERERKRLEDECIEKERQEAQAREEARLAEEARIAAEQARLENIARNAPEYAHIIRENQENMQRKIDEHSNVLASILTTLQSIHEKLPPAPQP